MTERKVSFLDTKILIGLFVVIFGALLLLRNMGYDTGVRFWDYWPVLLILIGLRLMLQPLENRQFITGLIFAAIGVILLLNNLEIIDFRWSSIWPLIIILIGLSIIFNNFGRFGKRTIDRNFINLSMILGGGEFRFDNKELQGGSITAIMGGGSIDLRDADISTDEITIDNFALMGSIEYKVPASWQIIINGTPILGGMENKSIARTSNSDPAQKPRRLIIKGMAIMGGIDVRN
jgi:hypothetical protein